MQSPTITLPADQASDILKEITRRFTAAADGISGEDAEVYPVPPDGAFVDDDERALEFIAARDLGALYERLVEQHHERLAWTTNFRFKFLWKKEGGESQGALVFGKCQKASGMLQYWSDADFIIWLAADHCRRYCYSRYQCRALLFHELLHASLTDKLKPTVRAHDAELFLAELLCYGLWDSRLTSVGRAVKQLPLDGLEG